MRRTYKIVQTVNTKTEAQRVANSMQRRGYERVRITKKGKQYNIWAFC